MTPGAISIVVFVACYALFVIIPRGRAWTACAGAVVLVLAGALSWREALYETISWNVVGLFWGTLILAELFLQSRMPAVLAELFVRHTRSMRGAMLAVCTLSGLLSMFVENVAVVLLVAPVAFSLADKLRIPPAQLLICIAACSNLQGTATLIGDPPSMILAGHMKLTFNDFFVYHGKAGIFFAVQVGALAATAVMAWFFRKQHRAVGPQAVETVRGWTPSVLMALLVLGLALTSTVDPNFEWLAGTYTLVLAAVGLVWFRLCTRPRWGSVRHLVLHLDWSTTFFLIGVFVVVGAMTHSGILTQVAHWMAGAVGADLLTAFVAIVVISVVISGFVDNVPFLLAMIPVVQAVADELQAPGPLLLFALLIGSCLGGNITPIGASANVVTLGMLQKKGHSVGFGEYMKTSIPFTIAAVLAASAFVWWVWAP